MCDGGFAPCFECRLAQGDGEAVAVLCADVSVALAAGSDGAGGDGAGGGEGGGKGGGRGAATPLAFFDFDRTLCTTKSGGSPLQGKHALDAELAAVAASMPTSVESRLTPHLHRNSHLPHHPGHHRRLWSPDHS